MNVVKFQVEDGVYEKLLQTSGEMGVPVACVVRDCVDLYYANKELLVAKDAGEVVAAVEEKAVEAVKPKRGKKK